MNARNIIKALALLVAVASPLALGGCTQRLIIEEQTLENGDETESIELSSSQNNESAIGNQALYVRSGETDPGETQAGPHPEPWQQRLGPHPEPWRRDTGDDGTSPPPPPSDSKPGDPNPKP